MRKSENPAEELKKYFGSKHEKLEYYQKALNRFHKTHRHVWRGEVLRSIEHGVRAGKIILTGLVIWLGIHVLGMKWESVFFPVFFIVPVYAFWWTYQFSRYRLMFLFSLGESRDVCVEAVDFKGRYKGTEFYTLTASRINPLSEKEELYKLKFNREQKLLTKQNPVPEVGQEIPIYADPQHPEDCIYADKMAFLTHCLDNTRLQDFSADELEQSQQVIKARTRIAVLCVLALPVVCVSLFIAIWLMMVY